VEEGVLENKRRPKTINLHHRSGGQTKSRSSPISLGRKIDEVGLFELARSLLGQLIIEGKVWPCANISLSVGGFEDGVTGNMGIGSFLLKGDEAKAMHVSAKEPSKGGSGPERPDKRRRIEATAGIQRFFGKAESTEEQHDEDIGSQDLPATLSCEWDAGFEGYEQTPTSFPRLNEAAKFHEDGSPPVGLPTLHQQYIMDSVCSRCKQALDSADDLQSHQDWHLAKDLQDEDRGRAVQHPKASTPAPSKKPVGHSNKRKAGRGKEEKGQSKLAFG
jgi:DNA polymerase eta